VLVRAQAGQRPDGTIPAREGMEVNRTMDIEIIETSDDLQALSSWIGIA
jgi:hypothetical protein